MTTVDLIGLAALVAWCAIIGWLFWDGMNRTLCDRGYTPSAYAEMQLNCTQYRR